MKVDKYNLIFNSEEYGLKNRRLEGSFMLLVGRVLERMVCECLEQCCLLGKWGTLREKRPGKRIFFYFGGRMEMRIKTS